MKVELVDCSLGYSTLVDYFFLRLVLGELFFEYFYEFFVLRFFFIC